MITHDSTIVSRGVPIEWVPFTEWNSGIFAPDCRKLFCVYASDYALIGRKHVLSQAKIKDRWIEAKMGPWGEKRSSLHVSPDSPPDFLLALFAEIFSEQIEEEVLSNNVFWELGADPAPYAKKFLIQDFAETCKNLELDQMKMLNEPRPYNISSTSLFDQFPACGNHAGIICREPALMQGVRVNIGVGGFTVTNSGGKSDSHISWSGHAYSYNESANIAILEAIERTAALKAPSNRYRPGTDHERCISSQFVGQKSMTAENFSDWHRLSGAGTLPIPAKEVWYADDELDPSYKTTSNGMAVGADTTDAVTAAIWEIVERDAVIGGWYGGLHCSHIKGITQEVAPRLCQVLHRAQRLGINADFYYLSWGTVGSTVICKVNKLGGEVIGLGSASRAELEKACMSALGEALTVHTDMEKLTEFESQRISLLNRDPWQVEDVRDHTLLLSTSTIVKELDTFLDADSIVEWSAIEEMQLETFEAFVKSLEPSLGSGYYYSFPVETNLPNQVVVAKVIFQNNIPIEFGSEQQPILKGRKGYSRVQELSQENETETRYLPHPFP